MLIINLNQIIVEILVFHHVLLLFQNYQMVSANPNALKMNILMMIVKTFAKMIAINLIYIYMKIINVQKLVVQIIIRLKLVMKNIDVFQIVPLIKNIL